MQDQLAGLAGAATQFYTGTGRERIRVEAQVKRQHLVVADQARTGQQLLWTVFVVDHQQRQFHFSTCWHTLQRTAQFALIGRQRAEVRRFPGFLLRLFRCRAWRWRLRLGCIAAAGDQQAEKTEQNEWSQGHLRLRQHVIHI
ncbi:hypothetical protein D3C81_1888420 [compost metagenome]